VPPAAIDEGVVSTVPPATIDEDVVPAVPMVNDKVYAIKQNDSFQDNGTRPVSIRP